jgi:hypothetical protein
MSVWGGTQWGVSRGKRVSDIGGVRQASGPFHSC